MGIPRFYKWLSERYPLINNPITENNLTLPDFDNFYLDMNGIIHNCSHPQDDEVAQGLSMKDMILGICRYIDRLVQLIRPVKVLYLAVDGCAPRAKMNQQRSRRFRSAKTQEEVFAKAESEGEKIDLDTLFDSNCITPGTPFMAELHEHMKFFIQKKIKEDPVWQRFETIYSGHNVPGEGEHKIMSYIREERAKPDYNPNTRHCMCGLDADLIMLALVSHEPHFSLLRKQVDFSAPRKSKAKNTTKQVTRQTKELHMQLLSITILRQYLDLEFSSDPDCPDFYDFDRVLNDWICICALCGNDFLPHLPSLDIAEGAIERLVGLYKKKLKHFGGFLTDINGAIHPQRFEEYLREIGIAERDTFQARAKREAKHRRNYDLPEGARKGDEWSTQPNFKEAYYKDKFGVATAEQVGGGRLREEYFRGLNWVMSYYVVGCQAWGWYFPFHYAPMASDMVDIANIDTRMQRGQPFPPFSQLLGCLPPFSSRFLPKAFQPLMTSKSSSIIDFYPKDFDIDMNGSRSSWGGVNLLSFVDAGRLSSAVKDLEHLLTPAEVERNKVGTTYVYSYDPSKSEDVESAFITVGKATRDASGRWTGIPIGFDSFSKCPCRITEIAEPPDNKPLQARLLDGVQLHLPGYPALDFLPIQHPVTSKAVAVNVFGFQSRKESLIISIDSTRNSNALLHGTPLVPAPPEPDNDDENSEEGQVGSGKKAQKEVPADHPDCLAAAASVIGQVCYIKYPHLIPAVVTGVITEKARYKCSARLLDKRNCRESWLSDIIENGETIPTSKIRVVRHTAESRRRMLAELDFQVQRHLKGSTSTLGYGATVVEQPGVLVETLPLEKLLIDRASGASRMSFAPETRSYTALSEVTLAQSPTEDERFVETPPQSIQERFALGQTVLSLHSSCYGIVGKVVGHDEKASSITMKASVPKTVLKQHGFGMQLIYHPKYQEKYYPQYQVAKILGIRGDVLGRIVSSVTFAPGFLELGLNLRVVRRAKSRQPDGTPRVWLVLPQYCRMIVQREKPNMSLGSAKSAKPTNDWQKGAPKHTEKKRARGPQFEFSGRAIQLIQDYAQQFPQLLNYLANTKETRFTQEGLNAYANDPKFVDKVTAYLNDLPTAKSDMIPATTRTVSKDVSLLIERAMDAVRMKETADMYDKEFKVPVWSLLLPPTRDWSMPVPQALNADGTRRVTQPVLGERVINVGGASVPFGTRGIVITIHPHSQCVEVVWELSIMGAHSLAGMCSNGRGTLVAWSKVISLTRPVVCNTRPGDITRNISKKLAAVSLSAPAKTQPPKAQGSAKAKKGHSKAKVKANSKTATQSKAAPKQNVTAPQHAKKATKTKSAAASQAEASASLKNILGVGQAAPKARAPQKKQQKQQIQKQQQPKQQPKQQAPARKVQTNANGNALLSMLRGGLAPTSSPRTTATASAAGRQTARDPAPAPASSSGAKDDFFDNLGSKKTSSAPAPAPAPAPKSKVDADNAAPAAAAAAPTNTSGDGTKSNGMILPVQMLFK